jgi:hypothetical protein
MTTSLLNATVLTTAHTPQTCEEATWEANCSNTAAHKVTWKDDAGVSTMAMCDLHTEEFKEASEHPKTDIAWTMVENLSNEV